MTARMPGALPHLCTASGAGLRTARAGVRASFVVLAFDAEGKRKLIGGDAFAARLIGHLNPNPNPNPHPHPHLTLPLPVPPALTLPYP